LGADHYRTLNVSVDAENEVVRAAYLALMRKHHPDVVGDDPAAQARAQAISVAFATLGDPIKRAKYDRDLQGPAASGAASPKARPAPPASSRGPAAGRGRPATGRGPTLDARRRRLRRVRWASIGLFALAIGLVAAGAAGVLAQIG
jgi:curved DNA-binding protein CbpA